ncbi:MAG TPA: DUF4931 domain-containing protein [Bacilli bacterium]
MHSPTHLFFDVHIGRQKPESIINRETACPFCDKENLHDILAQDGPILLIKNKFPVLADALMTVLIETDTCEGELSIYPKEHLYRLFRFGIAKWLEMEQSGDYSSVLFFKNYGPLSGGSIYHPHMQIIGLHNMNYQERIFDEHFVGLPIADRSGVTLNLSTMPKVGFFEFNVVMNEAGNLPAFADYIQIVVHYLLNHFNRRLTSYNLFFYHIKGKIAAKIMPRFPTSPIFIGYSIPQVSNRLQDVADDIKRIYLGA